MADRGRDLKVGILSDASKFDLSDPADQLEQVGTNAASAAKDLEKQQDELRRLAVQGKDAERALEALNREAGSGDLKEFGTDAEATAKKADSAFERIAASSKSNLRDVGRDADHGMRQAGEATETFRDEAKSNLSEVASSFTGSMDSAVDVVQGTLGGIVSDLGPLGAAVGAAGAAAVGLIYTRIQEARQAVKDLATDLISAGGRLGKDDIFSRIAEATVENEGDVRRLIEMAKELGLAGSDIGVAFSGSSDEIDGLIGRLESMKSTTGRTNAEMDSTVDTLGKAEAVLAEVSDATKEQDDRLAALQATLRPYAEQAKKAEEVQRLFAEATGISLDTLTEYQSVLDGIAGSNDDMATAVEIAAKRQADATTTTKDSWTDYRDTAVASIDDVIAAQERDLQASAEFSSNTKKVYASVGEAGVQWALSQGENADKAMQMLANAPKDKQQEIVANYKATSTQSMEETAKAIIDGETKVKASAQTVHGSAAAELKKRIDIPVGVSDPTDAELEAVRLRTAQYMRDHPVKLAVIPTYGTGKGQTRRVT